MKYSRILTVQDISCLGQCSLTVALPVISACGAETCILPSAVLSTHTGGFSGYTCLGLTDEMKKIISHFDVLGARFAAVYTGYLADGNQVDVVLDIMRRGLGDLLIVDPVMADAGKLYPAFDSAFVNRMKELCSRADIILPNITEACLLTGIEYRTEYDEAYIRSLANGLISLGAKRVVLTGVGYGADSTGVAVYDGQELFYYNHRRIPKCFHGTGDVFASAFTGAYVGGKSEREAAVIAADFVLECIENTLGDEEHWYGVKFEPCLASLIKRLK